MVTNFSNIFANSKKQYASGLTPVSGYEPWLMVSLF